MKKIFPILLSLFLIILLPLPASAQTTLQQVKDIVKSEYVGELNGNIDNAKSISEVINMLDPYSTYFTKKEYEAFVNSINMSLVGIGVVIENHAEGLLITEVIEGGSAYQIGLKAGDIITKVDNVSLKGKSVEQGQSLLLGNANTTVTLEVLRENGKRVVVKLTRQPFSLPNAWSKLLYGNVGYIKLSSFSDNAADLITKEYYRLKNQGATSYIIDLQGNGGGYVESAVNVIALFQYTNYAYKAKYSPTNMNLNLQDPNSGYVRSNDNLLLRTLPRLQPLFDNHTKVLVNRYSASASEMVTASLLDAQAATIYGERTYGKGTMQGFYPLNDGSILKLTFAEFFGPKGTRIHQLGVTPNVVTQKDPIYQAHYDSIKQKLAYYRELNSMYNVPSNKTFKVTLNAAIGNITTNDVELVALGGNKVDVSIQVNRNQIYITPKSPLQPGGEYMLVVHPTIKNIYGYSLTNGIYLRATVSAN